MELQAVGKPLRAFLPVHSFLCVLVFFWGHLLIRVSEVPQAHVNLVSFRKYKCTLELFCLAMDSPPFFACLQ